MLRADGTIWVNMGDSYASVAGGYAEGGSAGKHDVVSVATCRAVRRGHRRTPPDEFKAKDLMGMPWRLAFALQDDGWYLRQDIIWNKPNPMPESVRDLCTKSHEHIFLLSKSKKYYFDQTAILEHCSPNTHARLSQDVQAQIGSERANGGAKSNGNMKATARKSNGVGWGHGTDADVRKRGRVKDNESMNSALAIMPTERNKRSVWTVATHSFKGAHFATFPPDLIRPCILAGAPRCGVVWCGAGPIRRCGHHAAGFDAGRSPVDHLRTEPRVCGSGPRPDRRGLDGRRGADGRISRFSTTPRLVTRLYLFLKTGGRFKRERPIGGKIFVKEFGDVSGFVHVCAGLQIKCWRIFLKPWYIVVKFHI
ncbi:DNA methyltransferase [Pseudomonas syringae]|uniref:DNA methyltransferase n=1 Tax=Pseudomonas syringae TaxID=317 RepID=UPI001F1022E4|nr:DNA methyltransferase [Pseudomonas syringae]MCH5515534.1 site-specific DNA-methyltransferase [Pseudomonas syringae pv. syringae]MCH5626988.1 site-specific DNA-methyltransferase [Pseudomonas syringae pv. syringae]